MFFPSETPAAHDKWFIGVGPESLGLGASAWGSPGSHAPHGGLLSEKTAKKILCPPQKKEATTAGLTTAPKNS